MHRNRLVLSCAGLAVAVSAACVAFAGEPAKDVAKKAAAPAAGEQQMQLPPGMTAEDMQACMTAATPGPMHARLAESVGVWTGKNTMWMTPAAEPVKSESVGTFTPMLDGRFIKCEMAGDIPGMGPFNGFAVYGFDNVSQKFQCTWIDNCGTGMMVGTGDLSSDGKVLTWNFTYNCPILKKPTTMREIETFTGKDTRKMEMWGTDPKSGKEFKMMEIEFTRKPGASPVTRAN